MIVFPELEAVPGLRHGFTLRHPDIDVDGERDEVLGRLAGWHETQIESLGFDKGSWIHGRQVHGNRIAHVDADSPTEFAETDGLITTEPGRVLGIYVADCCAVFLVDPVARSLGLVHSGRKGTELNITGEAIDRMITEHGADPMRMQVRLSPCIRPPAYEVDFAEAIRDQAAEAGVPRAQVHDDGICTTSDASRFYSYRQEKGRTGRMLALLGWQ